MEHVVGSGTEKSLTTEVTVTVMELKVSRAQPVYTWLSKGPCSLGRYSSWAACFGLCGKNNGAFFFQVDRGPGVAGHGTE